MASGNIILVVDDSEVNREILAELFGDDFIILQAENGVQAMKIIRGHRRNLAAVLLDLVMPKMNGFEVLSEMKNQNLLFDVPVIIVTGMVDESERDNLIRKGASEVLFKPVNPRKVLEAVNKALETKTYRKRLETSVKSGETPRKEQAQDLTDAVMSIIKHPNMEQPRHMLRVSAYTRILLTEFSKISKRPKLTEDKINCMAEGALLHDVGKLVISTQILNKKGAMTEEEMSIMRTHCIQGCNIISIFRQSDKNDFLKYTYNICKFHHEHWDGTGYPEGVKGESIPICAQAVALATELDFFTAGGREFTQPNIEGIYTGRGSKYREAIIEAFKNSVDAMAEVKDEINKMDNDQAYDEVTRRLADMLEIQKPADAQGRAESYNPLLSLLDATVFEVDVATGGFRRRYTTFSDFTDVPQKGDIVTDFLDIMQRDVKEEFRDEVLSFLYFSLTGDAKPSTVPVSVTCQVYNSFHSEYQWYRISTVAMSWSPNTSSKLLLVLKNVNREINVQSEMSRITTRSERIERDIAKYRNENEKLKATARYDRVTDLYNKGATADAIEDIITNYPGSVHGMMLINIDYFKTINDRYGHREGDKALKKFGSVINKQFRNCDVVGRRTGDEFIAFMSDVPDYDVLTLKAQNIVGSIRKLGQKDDMYKNITVSVGIAFYPNNGKTYAELLQKADAALSVAKQSGRNRYQVYEKKMKLPTRFLDVQDGTRRSEASRHQSFISSLYDIRFAEEISIVGVSEMIDRIGREYNLNDIYIVDHDSTDIVFKWSAGSEIERQYVTEEPLREFIDVIRFQCDDMEWICDDISGLKEEVRKSLKKNHVASFVSEPILRNNRPEGMVLFIREKDTLGWSEDMLEALRVASKIIRDHLLRVKTEKHNQFLQTVTGILVENQSRKVHIIDDSYRLLTKTADNGGPTWGDKCYKVRFGLDKPCAHCLIKHLNTDNERIEDAKTSATMVTIGRFNRVYVVIEKEDAN